MRETWECITTLLEITEISLQILIGVEVLCFILLTIEIPDVSVKMYTKLRSNRIQCLVRKEIIHESR